MITHNVIQGSQEWHDLRARHLTASEAPVMKAASSKVRRNELLHMKATGSEREYSDWVQRNLFDKGHRYEEMSRPIVEELIGDELFPTTGSDDDGWLLASFDGITMLGDTIYEHKMWNESLAQAVRDKDLPAEYYWQLEQQLLVSGADRAIFVVSDGTRENFEWMEYRPVEGRAKQLIAGWKQFEEDLTSYVPTEQKPQAVGRTPENLPSLRIEVSGEVTASNLAEYREHAIAVIKSINRELTTDQDFADAEKTIKWCKDVEDRLVAAKEHALSQTATIDELFKTIDDISAEARATRLELNRLVTAEKENLRNKIRTNAEADFTAFVQRINKRLEVVKLPTIECNVANAMKGKRTLETLQDAADSEVARAKIAATEAAERIEENLSIICDFGNDHPYLFADKQSLVEKSAADLTALIAARITNHEAQEKAKREAEAEKERERIRAEEAAKLKAETKPVEISTPEPAVEAPANKGFTAVARKPDYVSIPRSEYESLLADSRMLAALQSAGVDNWEGYSEALEAA